MSRCVMVRPTIQGLEIIHIAHKYWEVYEPVDMCNESYKKHVKNQIIYSHDQGLDVANSK